MARSLNDIKKLITDTFVSNMAEAGYEVDPTTWSAVNLQQLLIYIMSVCQYVLEQLFATHENEVTNDLLNLQPPTTTWYANKILAFQLGFALLTDSDQFNNGSATPAQIAASKVISYAAVQRNQQPNGFVQLQIKINGSNGTNLTVLPADTLADFGTYLISFQPAGDSVIYGSYPPDSLQMKWNVYYDPTILKADGSRQDGTASTPVQDAIQSFLMQQNQNGGMSFNGQYSITNHRNWVLQVPGVVAVEIGYCQASYSSTPYQAINEFYQPNGGYLQFINPDTDLVVNFIPKPNN